MTQNLPARQEHGELVIDTSTTCTPIITIRSTGDPAERRGGAPAAGAHRAAGAGLRGRHVDVPGRHDRRLIRSQPAGSGLSQPAAEWAEERVDNRCRPPFHRRISRLMAGTNGGGLERSR